MPEKARVFVAEDNPDCLENIKMVLGWENHIVSLTATTLKDALEAIATFPELGIQVASIDGNLKKGDISGSDGRQMVDAIRNVAPHVKIIGMSGSHIAGVDVDLGKDRLAELGKVVTLVKVRGRSRI